MPQSSSKLNLNLSPGSKREGSPSKSQLHTYPSDSIINDPIELREQERIASLDFDNEIKSYSQNNKKNPFYSSRSNPRINLDLVNKSPLKSSHSNSPLESNQAVLAKDESNSNNLIKNKPPEINVESELTDSNNLNRNSVSSLLSTAGKFDSTKNLLSTPRTQSSDSLNNDSLLTPFTPSMFPPSPFNKKNSSDALDEEEIHLKIQTDQMRDSVNFEPLPNDAFALVNRYRMSEESPYINSSQFVFSEHFPRKDIDLKYKRLNGEISNKPWYHQEEIFNTIREPIMESFSKSPKYGIHPSTLSIQKYNHERSSKTFLDYKPSLFGGTTVTLEPIEINKLKLNEKIIHPKDFETKNKFQVKMIHIESFNFGVIIPDHFKNEISAFSMTQILTIRACELTSQHIYAFENFNDLRFLDVTYNKIERYQCLLNILQKCKKLQILNASFNPCFDVQESDKDSTFDKLVLYLIGLPQYHLQSLNGVEITLDLIRNVVEQSGQKEHKKVLYDKEFDYVFNEMYQKTTLKEWEPSKITSLNLSNSNIHIIHVGNLYNLRRLNFENNELETLIGTGIEQLSLLKYINFSKNKISDPSCLEILQYCPSLLHVVMSDNPFPKNVDARLFLIYHTRIVKGLNNSPGLEMIDDKLVTMEERINAVKRYGELDTQKINEYHMELALINSFGHHELRCIKSFCRRIKKLKITGLKLTYFDLKSFPSVEYLDLSENLLRELKNLERLKRLKFLDVSENNINEFKLINQLKKLKNLRHLVLKRTTEVDSKTRIRESRIKILSPLLEHLTKLSALDNIPISIEERIEVMKENNATNYQLNQYIFNVSIVEQVIPGVKRSYSIRNVAPRVSYHPSNITELHLSNLKLLDYGCDFTPFDNLERVDLSNNQLVNIEKTGLLNCTRIRVLDLRNNLLNYHVRREFVPIIDHFPDLEILAVSGNPMNLNKESKRNKFLKNLKIMQDYGSKFQILDTRIKSDERQKLSKFKGEIEVEAERVRFDKIMSSRGYTKCAPDEVIKITLNDTGLSFVSLSEFSMLQVLLLRSCHLKTLDYTGIYMLNNIRCLDLRDNLLSEIVEILKIINLNEKLETISISANRFKVQNYRNYILGNCEKIRDPKCLLWELDEQEIRIDEIVDAWNQRDKSYNIDSAKFRFDTAIFRKYVTNIGDDIDLNEVKVVRQDIMQLDLSNLKLSYVNFEGFDYLKKLSLSNNFLTDFDLINSFLSTIQIQELDLSSNRIQNVSTIIELINATPSLEMIFFVGNPCYKKDSQENRLNLLNKLTGCKDPEWKLNMLNGLYITVDERIKGLTIGGKQNTRVEGLRLTLQLHFREITTETLKIDLKDAGLYSIKGLSEYVNMTHLNLSDNYLTDIPIDVVKNLKNLINLDIRNNNFKKDTILSNIAQIASLQVLRILGNQGIFSKEDPFKYAPPLFKTMRALHSIDGISNPFMLSNIQMQAAQYLHKQFEISPNSLKKLDFTFSKIERKHFWLIVLCLRELIVQDPNDSNKIIGPKTIKILKGNFKKSHVQNYRFILIAHIRTLKDIDGHKVNQNERLNTNSSLQKIKPLIHVASKTCPFIAPRLSFENVRDDLVSQNLKKIEKEEDEMLGDNSHSDDEDLIEKTNENDSLHFDHSQKNLRHSNKSSPEKNNLVNLLPQSNYEILKSNDVTFATIHYYFSMTRVFKLYEQLLQNRNKSMKYFGVLLEKLEQIIFYLQLWSIFYVQNISWPNIFSQVASFIPLSNLSIESPLNAYNYTNIPNETNYFRYFVVILIPLLLFGMFLAPLKKKTLNILFYYCWPISCGFSFIFTIIGLILSIGIGLAIDQTSFSNLIKLKPPEYQFYWIFAVCAILVIILFIISIGSIVCYRKARYDEFFWNNFYLKLRTRISLFLLTIMYMPVMRSILVVYQCNNGKLFYFQDKNCPDILNDFGSVPWIWYVSLVFGVLYTLLIPAVFVIMISLDYRIILLDYSITNEMKALFKRKKYFFKTSFISRIKFFILPKILPVFIQPLFLNSKEKEFHNQKREIEHTYYRATDEFNSASSFLYSPYKRSYRYFRIYHLLYRFIVCAIASIAFTWPFVQIPLSIIVLLIHCLILLFLWPYIDSTSNLAEIIVSLDVILNIIFGYIISDNWYKEKFPYNIPYVKDAPTNYIILFSLNAITILIILAQLFFVPIRFIIQKIIFKRKMKSKLKNVEHDYDAYEEEIDEIELQQI